MNRPNGPGGSFQSKFSKQRLGGGGERRQMFQFPSQTKPKKAEEEWEDWDSSPLLGSKSIISVRDESSERAGRHSSGVDEWDKSPWVQNPKKPTTNLSTAESPSDAAPILPDSTSQADSIVLWADEPRNVEVRTKIKSDHFGQEEDWDSSQPAFQNRRKQTDFFANKKSDGEIGWTTPEKEGGRSKAEEAPQMQKSRIQNEHLFYGEMKTSHEAAASADRLARAQESLLKKMSESTVSDIEVVKPPLFAGDGEPMVVDEVTRDTEQLTAADESLLNKLVHSKLEELRDAEVTITNLQQDPCSPLFSVKSFEELHLRDELTKGVADMGFNQPSRIQETALAVILSDPPINMIAQSQSGTGKTAAFVLTMLTRTEMSKKYPQCLCLAPTYELAVQIGQVVEKMGRYLPEIKVAYAVRGRKISNGHKVKEQIIIGTPGTTLDWILKYKAFDATKINVFVLDEADVMISQQGHQDQSMRIDKTLKNCQQKLLFSATYDDQVMEFAQKIIPNPAVITVRREEQSLDNIRQYYVKCFDKEAKYRALANLYGVLTIGQCIVFCSTRKTANWLSSRLFADGHAVGILSGELDILQRASIIQRFKRGNEKVLISTNVSARGIDVQQVSLVINYDMPITVNGTTDFETYLHRIGRTGRFGKAGIAVNFVDSHWSFAIMQEIEEHFGKKIKQLDTENPDELERVEEGKH